MAPNSRENVIEEQDIWFHELRFHMIEYIQKAGEKFISNISAAAVSTNLLRWLDMLL